MRSSISISEIFPSIEQNARPSFINGSLNSITPDFSKCFVREENIDYNDAQNYILKELNNKDSKLNRIVLNKNTYNDDNAIMKVLIETVPSKLEPKILLIILRLKIDEVRRT